MEFDTTIRHEIPFVSIDAELCTGCGRCAQVCPVSAISGKSFAPHTIDYDTCLFCGQCVQICSGYDSPLEEYATPRTSRIEKRGMCSSVKEPLFAAHYRGDVARVMDALANDEQTVMVQCAPAVRVSLGEEFTLDYGALTPGKMAASLRTLGFDRIYDTNFAADLTIMEEGAELLERVSKGGSLPMFTSCCPGWVRYAELNAPDLLSHLSTCKSPQQMAGALIKTYGAQQQQIAPSRIFSVAIMPCSCKKYECLRDGMYSSGFADVDVVLTTRELAALIKHQKIVFDDLVEESFDSLLGRYSGAGNIFGNTGGVMEAALRSTLEKATGVPLESVDLHYVRGGEGFRRAEISHEGVTLRVGVVAGIQYVEPLLADVRAGKSDLHFVEVMCCPLGCISGGGQPKTLLPQQMDVAREARKASLYRHDREKKIRKSHENKEVQDLYKQFLVEPLGEKSHHLLHVHHKGVCSHA